MLEKLKKLKKYEIPIIFGTLIILLAISIIIYVINTTGLTLKVNIVDLYGKNCNELVIREEKEIRTEPIKIYSLYDEQYSDWLGDGLDRTIWHQQDFIKFKTIDDGKIISNKDNHDDYLAPYGEEISLRKLYKKKFIEGNCYSLQVPVNSNYSWEIKGCKDYLIIGSSIYFRYETETSITLNYHYYNKSENKLNLTLNTILDDKGNTYAEEAEEIIPTEDWAQYLEMNKRGLPDNFEYIITDENGLYLHFENVNSNLFYLRKHEEPYIIKDLRGMANFYDIPDGTYYIKQLDTLNKYHHSDTIKEFTITSGEVSNIVFINEFKDSKITLNQYYVDDNAPKPIQFYHVKIGSVAAPNAKFVYRGMSANGERIYEYNANGDITEIAADDKTIIKGLPMTSINILQITDGFTGDSLTGVVDTFNLSFDSPVVIKQQMFDNSYVVSRITKDTNRDTNIYIKSDRYDNIDYIYNYAYYETKEIEGINYKNVYEITGVIPINEISETSIINLVDGHAIIYGPVRYHPPYMEKNTVYPEHESYDTSNKLSLDVYEINNLEEMRLGTNSKVKINVESEPSFAKNCLLYNGFKEIKNFVELQCRKNYVLRDINIPVVKAPSISANIINNDTSTFTYDLYEGTRKDSLIYDFKYIDIYRYSTEAETFEYEYNTEDADGYTITFRSGCKLRNGTIKIFNKEGLELYSYTDKDMRDIELTIEEPYLKVIINLTESEDKTEKIFSASILPFEKKARNYEYIGSFEVKTGKPFILDEIDGEIINFEVDRPYKVVQEDDEDFDLASITAVNGEDKGYFEFWYTDDAEISAIFNNELLVYGEVLLKDRTSNKDPIEGTGYSIYDSEGNILTFNKIDNYYVYDHEGSETKIFTDENGELSIKGLHHNDYTIKEVMTPIGYEPDETMIVNGMQFSISKEDFKKQDGKNRPVVEQLRVYHNSTAIEVGIYKIDANTGEHIVGAKMKLTTKYGSTIESWETTGEPYYIEGLEIGKTYILKETRAAEGYEESENIEFVVTNIDEDGYKIETQIIEALTIPKQ